MRIKILIDGKPLLNSLTGIGRYDYEISKSLDNEKFDVFFDYGFLSKEIISSKKSKDISRLNSIKKGFIQILKKIFSLFPVYFKTKVRSALKKINENRLKNFKFDVYFQPNFIPLDVKASNIVVTIHDLTFIKFREFHPADRIDFFEKFFFQSIKKATKIVAGSYTTKKEIMDTLGIDENMIEVIYHGYDEDIFYPRDKVAQDAVKKELGIKEDFILFVGSIEPRKNLKTLIKAYNLLDKNLQDRFKLVIVGAKGWENSDIHALIKENENIEFLGYIDDENLAALYSGATAFVYPSVYEGFGIPPLEAMACGCPAILSGIEVFREIYQDSAMFFEVFNENDLKDKLLKVINDRELRENLSKSGLLHCKNFSWAKSAKEHSDLFLKLVT